MGPDTKNQTLATFDPSVALHHQIYLQLHHEIADGLWAGRKDFPGEREVAERFGASVVTARTALDHLRAQGLIERRRGRRPEVTHEPASVETGQKPMLFPVGRTRPYTYEVLFNEIRVAPAEACAAFKMDAGTELWQCSRLRRFEGVTHSVTHNVQLPEIGERHTIDLLEQRPMTDLLRAQGFNIARMRRRMQIGQAPTEVTIMLGLNMADPVLTTTFTLHDQNDALIQWVRIFLHPKLSTPEETMDISTGHWSASKTM